MKIELHYIHCIYRDKWEETGFGEWDELSLYIPDLGIYIDGDEYRYLRLYMKQIESCDNYKFLVTNLGEV